MYTQNIYTQLLWFVIKLQSRRQDFDSDVFINICWMFYNQSKNMSDKYDQYIKSIMLSFPSL